jgi:predicted lipoprotein with Yx(FWY)xxD motif
MKRSLVITMTVSFGVILAACGAGTSSSGTSASATSSPSASATASATLTVKTASMGQFLTDGSGKTLYLFEADKTSQSMCSGACAGAWPPFMTSGNVTASSGVNQSKIGTTTRSDGSKQVTYNGHPLYYFIGDVSAGDTSGQGKNAFGAEWYVVSPSGEKIEK